MAEDWKPGDLALCVQGGYIDGPKKAVSFPKEGTVYQVLEVRLNYLGPEGWIREAPPYETKTMAFLKLLGGPVNLNGTPHWGEVRFVKQKGHEEDEFDKEVIDIMAGRLLNYINKELT